MSVGIRQLETDVLILGGGLAALRAAIAAGSAGARVAVMTKGTAGRAGSSAITSAGFSVAIGQADPADSPQSHFADTIRGGGVNRRRLVEIFCEEAPARFWEMVSWGVQFERDAGTGRILQHPSGDHSHPRTAVCVQHKGIGMTLPLRAAAAGVEFLDRIIALDLMHDENGVSGVVALDQQTLELLAVRARATILATGGIGQLYPVTSNPNDVTGDGLALAYRAGARLVDMEFMQFYPWRLISYVTGRMPVQPSSFVAGAVLRNADGERFMLRYDPERGDATTRDIAARAIYTEILEGRGVHGGVRLDLSQAPLEEFIRLNPRVGRYFSDHGLDLATAELILAPEAHFLMGGVVIDENGRTSLPGLLAAGEVSGGSDGGNRLDSNAIPAGQVFGRRAAWPRPPTPRREAGPGSDRKPCPAGPRGSAGESASGRRAKRRRERRRGRHRPQGRQAPHQRPDAQGGGHPPGRGPAGRGSARGGDAGGRLPGLGGRAARCPGRDRTGEHGAGRVDRGAGRGVPDREPGGALPGRLPRPRRRALVRQRVRPPGRRRPDGAD